MDKPNFIPLANIATWANKERVRALAAGADMVVEALMSKQPFEDTDAVETQEGEDTYAPISA